MINRNLIQLFVVSICLLIAVMSLTVIRGWLMDDDSIIQMRPGYIPMKFNSALCFIFTSAATWALFHKRTLYAFPLALLALVISGLSAIQYLLDIDLGLDSLFAEPLLSVKTSHPGRMAPNTALNFLLLNAAIIFVCFSNNNAYKTIASISMGLIAFAFALIAMLGYGANLQGALFWGDFTAMSLHSAMSFVLLGTALVLLGIHQSELGNLYEIPMLPQTASIAMLLLTILMWFALQTTTSLYIQQLLDNHRDDTTGNLQHFLNSEVSAMQRMASRLEFHSQGDNVRLDHETDTYLEGFENLVAIAWVNNDNAIRYHKIKDSYAGYGDFKPSLTQDLPLQKTKDVVSFDLPPTTRDFPIIRISVPIWRGDKFPDYLVTLLNFETLSGEVLSLQSNDEYVPSIYLGNTLVLTKGESPDPRWTSRQSFRPGGVTMEIAVQATPGLIQKQQSYIPTIFLITGVLMSILIGTTLKLFQSSRKLTLKLGDANLNLHNSLKEVEQSKKALQDKSLALVQSNRDLENFASIASHDLSEPLRKVNMFGERLQKHSGPLLDDKGQQYLSIMTDGAQRMQALLTSLLEYSRVTTKGGEFGPTDLNAVLVDVQSDLAELIAENNAEISYSELPLINADYTQMRQLFQNLIANSIRYHKPGIAPKINIRVDQDNAPEDRIRIVVSDNGIGFEQQHAEGIFEVFKRLHSRSEYPGTGMGLAVCKRIMERHKGEISAVGELGVGAKFRLDFVKY